MAVQVASQSLTKEFAEVQHVLLGCEAVALGAVHAGISSAYAYPGTPSTEIQEFLQRFGAKNGYPRASWSANEKAAYEEAMGVSLVGRRALVSMKHVGLNVAADPFVNSALVSIHGGLVVAVADDPGMHSSQCEQDTRYYADLAHIPCLEPGNQQEAYEMTLEAFDLSERFQVPVVIRLVTRVAHSRAVVRTRRTQMEENELSKPAERTSWILLPAFARRQWRELLDRQEEMRAYSEDCSHNRLVLNPAHRKLGVITTGIARNYFLENAQDLDQRVSHLHVGAYPLPVEKIRALVRHVDRVLVLEDGYPYLERYLRGILPPPLEILGKLSGEIPYDGELDPDVVRQSLGLSTREVLEIADASLVKKRPPRLCAGCPHADSFTALQKALAGFEDALVTSDIGCYTLGALPPYSAIETCVCMGASVGMAKGAAEAGFHPVVAMIGDSTFLHSGVQPLMDAISADAKMTLIILDNKTVAMTGSQKTVLPSAELSRLILGLGVNEDHFHVVQVHPKSTDDLASVMGAEMGHEGLSVIVAQRECIESARKGKRKAKKADQSGDAS